MGRDVGTDEERSLYYKFKKKNTQSLNQKKNLDIRFIIGINLNFLC